jgi:hypothetical protein
VVVVEAHQKKLFVNLQVGAEVVVQQKLFLSVWVAAEELF